MANMEVRKYKDNHSYEVNLYYGKNSKAYYHNILNKDPNKIAQVLIDLDLDGFPIEKAIKLYRSKMKQKDWLGFEIQ